MAKLCGTVILEDCPSFEQVQQDAFHRILHNWGARHGNPNWQYLVDRPGHPLEVTGVKASHVYIDQQEISPTGRLWVGPFRAYLGDFQIILDDEAPQTSQVAQESFNFPEEILKFFEAMNFSEEERNKVLDMSIRDFLGTCQTAVSMAASEEPPTGTQAPWVLSRRQVLRGAVKCPKCDKSVLRIVDGNVECPVCGASFGDIDNLPEF